MLMPQSLSLLPLLLGGFILTSVPGEAVLNNVYYVTPTEPPNPDCPGEPCQTLDHYFSDVDRYFSGDKIIVTMMLLHGKHTMIRNSSYWYYPYEIKDLEMFEMIGMEPAHEVVVHIFYEIRLINITTTYIGTLTLDYTVFSWLHNIISNPRQSSKTIFKDRTISLTINSTLFNGAHLYIDGITNFNSILIVAHSTFTNQSLFELNSYSAGVRQLEVKGCTFSNSRLHLVNANITFEDTISTVMDNNTAATYISALYSNVVIAGNVLFSIGYFLYASSNVTIVGDVIFANSKQTLITAYFSNITLSGNISFLNNTGTKGGAMALYSSTLNIASNTSVYFYNNSATETGGALYVANNNFLPLVDTPCFYQLLDYKYNEDNWYNIQFVNNSAKNGGDHIYGQSMHSDTCYVASKGFEHQVKTYDVQKQFKYSGSPESLSPVSSDPTRVCLCDDDGQPQCANMSKIYVNINVHPGETFTLSAVVVGADLGTTVGTVYAIFDPRSTLATSQYAHLINNNTMCSKLNYTIFSHNRYEVLYLTVTVESLTTIENSFSTCIHSYDCIQYYLKEGIITSTLLYTPPLLYVTLLPCPPGFTLLGDPPGCYCNPVLTNLKNYKVSCQFIRGKGYVSWSGPMWLSFNLELYYLLAHYCPFDYCNINEKSVNLQDEADAQCLFNRAGRLCGGCKENYSLAIGSSHCIHCPNNNNLALLIFFAAAGFLLVFFISALNLTVTQGMINGLIFYANIVWTYQSILFPQQVESNSVLTFLRTFIAWLNLDFGIHTCFFEGMNALWKTWLQYIFPFYIWSIAGVIIIGARYSAKLTKLFGSRAVSVLATLFLLSYTKLLQTIIASVGFTPIKVFSNDNNYILTVWSLDGHYTYCHFPHVLLFIAALLIFILLWLPYTLVLFLVQWLRKISHLKFLKWIPRFNPVYDAYFAPLKDKHHYWFGVLLMVRGILLVIFTSTSAIDQDNINHLLLLMTSALLLLYANYHRVYKNRAVQLIESFFLLLLILVGGSGILEKGAKYVVYGSVAVAFLVFCGLILWNVFVQIRCKAGKAEREFIQFNNLVKQDISTSAQFRDSIFDELLHDK